MVVKSSEAGVGYVFRVYLPQASEVQLVGSFTGWRDRAVAMTREDTGWWSVAVPLPEGEHDFCYLVNSSTWLADYAASGVKRNSFGGWVSQLHVPADEVRVDPRTDRGENLRNNLRPVIRHGESIAA
jgi:1,4-alpha-glucan branching enzyme